MSVKPRVKVLTRTLTATVFYCFPSSHYFSDSFTAHVLWTLLKEVGLGQTVSYKQLAEMIGNPNAVRAVGSAMKKNPVSFVTMMIVHERLIYLEVFFFIWFIFFSVVLSDSTDSAVPPGAAQLRGQWIIYGRKGRWY